MSKKNNSTSLRRIFGGIAYFLKNADMLLLLLCSVASVFGIILISSATGYLGGGNSKLIVQTCSAILGIGVYIFVSIIDVDIIMDKWKWLFAFSILFLLLLIPFGMDNGTGNRSWLRFGSIGVQPAEVVKVLFVLMLAKLMTNLYERTGSISSPLNVLLILGFTFVMLGIVLFTSKDTGVALIYIIAFVCMAFVSGIHALWFVAGIGAIGAAIPYVWNNFLRDDQKLRILAPYFPEDVDPTGLDVTWHMLRSKLAVGSGGFWGMGLGSGTQTQSADASSLPERHTDFIFSVAGEELGFVGCVAIVLLLTAIILRIIYVGVKCRRYSGLLICSGIAGMMIFQTFENIGMCLGLTPVIGITLPFFSYGGTSMVTLFLAMGVVSSVKMHPAATRSRWVW